jgi:hypothetical protein
MADELKPKPNISGVNRPVADARTVETLVHSSLPDDWLTAAMDPRMTEDLALVLLARRDLPAEALEALAQNKMLAGRRKAVSGIVQHPRTPRHVALPLLRRMFTFDLMEVAITPVVPADLKRAAEGLLATRFDSITTGERLNLARRASGNIAALLLLDHDVRVREAALENPRLTEAGVVHALKAKECPPSLPTQVALHKKWSLRQEVRAALTGAPAEDEQPTVYEVDEAELETDEPDVTPTDPEQE